MLTPFLREHLPALPAVRGAFRISLEGTAQAEADGPEGASEG